MPFRARLIGFTALLIPRRKEPRGGIIHGVRGLFAQERDQRGSGASGRKRKARTVKCPTLIPTTGKE
jgi:hypothetical protein